MLVAILTVVVMLVGAAVVIALPILLVMRFEAGRMMRGMLAVRDALGSGKVETWKYASWRLPLLDAEIDGVSLRVAVEPGSESFRLDAGHGAWMNARPLLAHIVVRVPASRRSKVERALAAEPAGPLRLVAGSIEAWLDPPKGNKSRQRLIDAVRAAIRIARADAPSA